MSDKPMTAAQYAAHAEKVRAAQASEPEIVKMKKSGAVMLLQRINLKELVLLGIIPHSVISYSSKALASNGTYKPGNIAALNLDALVAQREVVARACVMPPFNEETANTFLIEDFEEIYDWAMGHQGVDGAKAVKTFRQGRKRGTSRTRANGKELQPTSESTATN